MTRYIGKRLLNAIVISKDHISGTDTKKLLASKTKTDPDELRDTEYEFEDVPSILD